MFADPENERNPNYRLRQFPVYYKGDSAFSIRVEKDRREMGYIRGRKQGLLVFIRAVLFINFIPIFLPFIIWADPLDNWHWRNPLPQGNDLIKVAYEHTIK